MADIRAAGRGVGGDAYLTRAVRRLYRWSIHSRVRNPLSRQRLKLFWFAWGYWHLFRLHTLTVPERITLIVRCLRIDWHVQHAHTPAEVSHVCIAIGARAARAEEIVVEAGCWQGGSAAKFSLLCRRLGYRLHVYDSFAGVERLSREEIGGGFDYSGTYAAGEELVRRNIARYGAPDICTFHPGWFSETLAGRALGWPVRVAYLDCDLAKGTREVLSSVMPALSPGGCVFSQDYHIDPVQRLLNDANLWSRLSAGLPRVSRLSTRLVRLSFPAARDGQ